MYYGWFDDDPKLTPAVKIQDAINAYIRRFGKRPNVVLVNEADVVEVAGVRVRPENFIRRHNFWVGYEDAGKAVEPVVELPVVASTAPEAAPSKRVSRKPVKLAA